MNDASLSYNINFDNRSYILSIYIAPFIAIFINMYWEQFYYKILKLGEMVPSGVNIHEHNMCLDVLLLCNKASEIV